MRPTSYFHINHMALWRLHELWTMLFILLSIVSWRLEFSDEINSDWREKWEIWCGKVVSLALNFEILEICIFVAHNDASCVLCLISFFIPKKLLIKINCAWVLKVWPCSKLRTFVASVKFYLFVGNAFARCPTFSIIYIFMDFLRCTNVINNRRF